MNSRFLVLCASLLAFAALLWGVRKGVMHLQERAGLLKLDPAQGRTTNSSEIASLVTLCLVFALGVLGLVISGYPMEGPIWIPYAIAAAGLGGACLFAPFQFHRWDWDAHRLRWRGLFRSEEIAWTEVSKSGVKWYSPYEFVITSKTGRKIDWTIFAVGSGCILAALQRYRPDLAHTIPQDSAGAQE